MNTLDMQRALAGLGYNPGPMDGVPGRMTTAALIRFQKAAGLVADGVAGPKTISALIASRGGVRVTDSGKPGGPFSAYPMTPWHELAVQNLNVAEVSGARNSPVIMGWVQRLGARVLGINVTDDETAWCGTFVAMCVATALPTEPLPGIAVRASSWDTFGVKIEPTCGAILRFERPGGGHVGFYDGEDSTHFHVLGGNQGNRVSVMRLEKSRLVASRWPSTVPVPKVLRKNASPRVGGVSRNEW